MRRALLIPLVVFCAIACDRQPPDLREWRTTDHDHTTNPGQDQVQGGPDAGVAPELAAHGLNEVVLAAWDQSCVRCHGRFGHGDGPQGPMVHAADLTNQRFQATASDDDILRVIKEGRGLMPAFPLPEPTLRSLVHLIRLLGEAASPAASATAAPLTSAAAGPHAPSKPRSSAAPTPSR